MNAKEILKNWAIAQNAGAILPCPRCGAIAMRPNANHNCLSYYHPIFICVDCGTDEFQQGVLSRTDPDYPKLMPENWFAVRTVFGQVDTPFRQTDGRWQVTGTKTVMVSQEDIDDIVGIALDGGITSWCCQAEPVGGCLGDCASEQISRGGTLKLYDAESDDVFELTREKLLKGIRLWIENEADEDGVLYEDGLDCCNVDANIADSMIQYALFGELVFC